MHSSIFWPALTDFRSAFPVFAQGWTALEQQGTKADLLWGDSDSGPRTGVLGNFSETAWQFTWYHLNSLSFCFPEGQISIPALFGFLPIIFHTGDSVLNPILSSYSQSTQTNISGLTLESETFDSNTESSSLYPSSKMCKMRVTVATSEHGSKD